jgi:hypothetical protein
MSVLLQVLLQEPVTCAPLVLLLLLMAALILTEVLRQAELIGCQCHRHRQEQGQVQGAPWNLLLQ